MNGITLAIVIGISIWALALGLTLWGTWLSLRLFRSVAPHLDAPYNLFPVSVIKPLKGADDELEANLESFFRLDYPDYEILFCVAHPADPAAQLARRLIARHPRVKARLFVGEVAVGPNPKINNMINAFEGASNDWILISDSNVRVDPAYLKKMVANLSAGVGMVTSVVTGRAPKGLGGGLEATYLNTFYARGMNIAAGFGRVCVVGKSMLFQRSAARRFGGLRTLGRYLAEDYMAGEAMRKLGLKVVIASEPVNQIIGEYSFGSFWKRHLRWGRIRKRHGMTAFLLEPCLGCFASGAIGAWALSQAMGASPASFFLFHLLIWSACDLLVMRSMRVPLQWATPLHWFLRELLALPLWVHIASGNTVDWRGHRLAVRAGGILDSQA